MLQGCTAMIRVDKGFAAVTMVSFIFAILFGGNLPFYIFYSMLTILIISYIYIRIIKQVFSIEAVIKENVLSVGDSASMLIKVKFGILLPVPYIEILCNGFVKSRRGFFGCIRNTTCDENIWIESSMVFDERGIYIPDSVFVKIKDLFHIFSYEHVINTGISVRVYPRIFNIKPIASGGMDIYRETLDTTGRHEDQFTIRDVRKYREGDSLKKIHWKLSAKHDDLYVKNVDVISGKEIILFIDMDKGNYSFDEYGAIEESIVDFSTSIAYQVVNRNLNAEVFINSSGKMNFEINDRSDFDRLMEHLLIQKSDGCTDIIRYINENACRLHRMNRIVVVTAAINDNLSDYVIKLNNSGYNIAVFYCLESSDQTDYAERLRISQVECYFFKDCIYS